MKISAISAINKYPAKACEKAIGLVLGNSTKNNPVSNGIGEVVSKIAPWGATGAGAASFFILTNGMKDGVNGYFYYNQTSHNKRIPEEKRKFVAMLELANCALNLTMGIGLGYLFSNDNVVKFIYKKVFKNNVQKIFNKIHTEIKKKPGFNEKKFLQETEKMHGNFTKGLKALIGLFVVTILAKRMLTPLIATPMAGYFKLRNEKKLKNNKNKSGRIIVKTESGIKIKNKPETSKSADAHDKKPVNPNVFKAVQG